MKTIERFRLVFLLLKIYSYLYKERKMVRYKRHLGLLITLLMALSLPVYAQDEDEGGGFGFGFDLGIGAETFNELDGSEVTYQTLSLNPDFAIGPFGIGLAITLHYRFNGGEANDEFEVRSADWIPEDAGKTFLELYLPMFRYIRWGLRGDPLFIKLGSIDDATLGNGFIMGNYANTLFLPELRVFGLNFDLDGSLFNFPYIGMQSFIGNLANIDIIGGRLYGRPLLWLEVPVIKNIELGFTVVGDIDPYYHDNRQDGTELEGSIVMGGVDIKVPILANPIISLVTFGDVVNQNSNWGGMFGFGGKFFSFLPYMFQLRILGENFIPVYFGPTYDVYRADRYETATSEVLEATASAGWYANTGFSFLEDKLALSIALDGPFAAPPEDEPPLFDSDGAPILDPDTGEQLLEKNPGDYPHLRATFLLGEGLLPGFDFYAFYDKSVIETFADLIDPTNAVIGAGINYKTGPAVLTLEYDLVYSPTDNPEEDQWVITARLMSSISIF